MKRVLVSLLLLALLLSAGTIAASGEEDSRTIGLMDLYDVSGEKPVWMGTAISVYDGVLLASASILPEDPKSLLVTDGTSVWDVEAAIPDQAGILMTVMYDITKQPAAYTNYVMTDLPDTADPSSLTVFSGDENRSRINRTVDSVAPVTWQSMPCLLASVSGPVKPGSPLLTKDNKLAGIAVADWAEGTNRVLFLSADGMIQSMAESLDVMMAQQEIHAPEGFVVTVEGNVVRFDWSAMPSPEILDGEKLYLVIADTMNRYFTYFEIPDEKTIFLTLTPGRTYRSSIVITADTPSENPDEFVLTTLPPAEKLTDYGFTSRVCALAVAPEGGLPDGALPEPVTKVTEELLRSGRVYYYSSSTYQVTETIQDVSLLVTLTDPEGNNYRYESKWIYDPSYMNDDTWAVSLDNTGLLGMLNESGYPEGTYTVDMYIGGALADSFTFDLP